MSAERPNQHSGCYTTYEPYVSMKPTNGSFQNSGNFHGNESIKEAAPAAAQGNLNMTNNGNNVNSLKGYVTYNSVPKLTDEESSWNEARRKWLTSKTKLATSTSSNNPVNSTSMSTSTSTSTSNNYISTSTSNNYTTITVQNPIKGLSRSPTASSSSPTSSSSPSSSSQFDSILQTSPRLPGLNFESLRVAPEEVDFDLLYCDLTERNGRLSKKVPLSALVSTLIEVWEDQGLYDELEEGLD